MGWKVLHLKPRCEKKVAEQCERMGLEYYLPLRKSLKVYAKRRAVFEIPLFTGYIFVKFDPDTTARTFRGNYIVRIMTPLSSFAMLRQLVQIRRLLELDPELEAIDPLEPGDTVRIKAGPLAGFTGQVIRLKKRPTHRLVLLNVEIVGQTVAAEIETRLVEHY